jgi:Ca2+-binding EF-hand superfamily protein
MKKLIATALAGLVLLPFATQAADDETGGRPQRPQRNNQRVNPDTDKDGLISDAEADAAIQTMTEKMRAGFKKRNEMVLKNFDKDGDGALNADELAALEEKMAKRGGGNRREKMLERFDKDGDGKLSEDERSAMRQAMKERRQQNDEQD